MYIQNSFVCQSRPVDTMKCVLGNANSCAICPIITNEHFCQLCELCVQIIHKVQNDNQLIEIFLMMCNVHISNCSSKSPHTYTHTTHSHTELFNILFSLLTLSTAFLQNASGPGKNYNSSTYV